MRTALQTENNLFLLYSTESKCGSVISGSTVLSHLLSPYYSGCLYLLNRTHRQSSKPRPIENEKMCKIFRVRYGRILGGSWSTNTPYWLKHNRLVLPTNTKVVTHSGRQVADWFLHPNTIFRSYSFSPGYVGEYKCTLVGLNLLVCLWLSTASVPGKMGDHPNRH